jgi:predicted ATP-dependent endonuclease of OLD family
MRYSYFEVRNFKGIEQAKLDFSVPPRGRVYTLIGLNESGKTTLLEAMNFLSYKFESLDPLNLPGYSVVDVHDVIPISKRANFNDKVVIRVGVELTEPDRDAIVRFVARELGGRVVGQIGDFSIEQSYQFVNSRLASQQPSTVWTLRVDAKLYGQRKPWPLQGDEWAKLTEFVKSRLPSVLYFPNFLFEFPDRIYLDDPPANKELHEFFRRIVQDVLDALGGNIDWRTHVLERAKSGAKSERQALGNLCTSRSNAVENAV